jgi:predicted DNA-binding transcriptional regulator AlpA
MIDADNFLQRLLQEAAKENSGLHDLLQRLTDIPRLMLDEDEVEKISGLSRATRHRLIAKKQFPDGVYVAPNRKRWFASDIANWQRSLETDNPFYNPNRGRGHGRRPRQLSIVSGSSDEPDMQTAAEGRRRNPNCET